MVRMYRIFLPFIPRPARLFDYPLGVDIEGKVLAPGYLLQNRHYKIQVRGDIFEPYPNTYVLDAELKSTLSYIGNAERYICFKFCPPQNRLWSTYRNSPPADQYLPDFGRAAAEAVLLTKAKYIEPWNEPDVVIGSIPTSWEDYLGAVVGIGESWYQGGERYGKMLMAVDHALKASGSTAGILAGALICDDIVAGETNNIEFLQGAMAATGGSLPCKAVSIHPYLKSNAFAKEEGFRIAWDRVMAHVDNIRSLTDKPVVFSETAILLDDDFQETPLFRQRQVDWVVFLKTQIANKRLAGVSWYNWASVWPWMHCSLIRGAQRGDKNLQPTPVYLEWAK